MRMSSGNRVARRDVPPSLRTLLLIPALVVPGVQPVGATEAAAHPHLTVTTFETVADGGSRFRDIEIPLALSREDGEGHRLHLSPPMASPKVQFVELPAGLDQDWHNAPARQFVMVLSGVLEVETTDGATRRWQAGEVLLPADVTGKGHRTRCIGGPVRVLFAPLPDDFDPTALPQ